MTQLKAFYTKVHAVNLRLRHKATGKSAIGYATPDGTVVVQFNDINHPHGHGWHLYPRHHFVRRRHIDDRSQK